MFNFLSLKSDSFGLDFSDYALRLVKLQETRTGFNVASFNETMIPEGIIRNGEIKDEKTLIEIVKKAVSSVKGEKLGTKYVIASLPERKAFLRIIQMPCLSEEDLKSAVMFEAENYIPLPVNEVYLDSQIISTSDKKIRKEPCYDVLIAALPKATVDPYFSVLKGAGLIPLALEIESFSILRALIEEEKNKFPLAVIDLGEARTAFITFSGLSLRDSFTIPVSARDFTASIARTFNVDMDRALSLKIKHGFDNKSPEGKEVFDALTPVLTDLVEQIKKYLDYYKTHSNGSKKSIEKVLLNGGDAALVKLPEILTEQLGAKVEIGNPWVNVISGGEKITHNFPLQRSLLFSSAIGLALRAVKQKEA